MSAYMATTAESPYAAPDAGPIVLCKFRLCINTFFDGGAGVCVDPLFYFNGAGAVVEFVGYVRGLG